MRRGIVSILTPVSHHQFHCLPLTFFLIRVPSAHSLGWAQDLSVYVTGLPGRVFERKMAGLMPSLVCFWSTVGPKVSSRAVMMLPHQRPRMDHQGLEN